MNTFGNLFRITSFGESHGKAVGVIIDNCPPLIELCEADIQADLDRRRPGQSHITTPRDEADQCEILSGVFEGKTTGTSIAVVVWNKNQESKDYGNIKDVFRPSHADFGYDQKYGIRDYRGGGRSSARETIARVIGGAVAKKILKEKLNVEVWGFVDQVGEDKFKTIDKSFIEKNPLRMADEKSFPETLKKVEAVKQSGDSIGGSVQIRVENAPVGLGSPVFGKLEAELARAIMSVPATKGIEFGEGFDLSAMKGSEANDPFVATTQILGSKNSESADPGIKYRTQRNANGGIIGGISTGDDIWFRVGIKPTSSIIQKQTTANKAGENVEIEIKGRHDPILVPRAVPILEAMTAMVILDHVMLHKAQCGL
ncbi:chorismate synthase [bacterium]|nr:chorismate synthase [bacterium]NCQ54960.1 chorismate synthase [Candidatus Parcubacteria bacterium]NCS67004.1 chorismate synthase [Candidatus Peregrinibacteria bacterium]NCS95950.1 chorismate synthase [bacterium]